MNKFESLRAGFKLPEHLIVPWRPCRVRVLVVTDGSLSYSPSEGFGLSQFVDTLKSSSFYGLLPSVKVAHRTQPTSDYATFSFKNDLSIDKFDVAFLFGFDGAGDLGSDDLNAIVAFMEARGGLFATGDHGELGATMCAKIPRVRSMRKWRPGTDMSSPSRITTNSPGEDGVFTFNDQADDVPQRTYPRYYAQASNVFASDPHVILRAAKNSGGYIPIEYQPDHPHEGECIEAPSLTEKLVPGSAADEFRANNAGVRPAPQIVAYAMSYGGAFTGKNAVLNPRTFGSICAYDGRSVGVGRVVTDSTWHHFVNVNIDGTSTARKGLRDAAGNDTPELVLIRQYWRNMVTWLARPRHCHPLAAVAFAMQSPRLAEELLPNFERQIATPEGRSRAAAEIEATLASELNVVELDEVLASVTQAVFGDTPAVQNLALARDLRGAALVTAAELMAPALRHPQPAAQLEQLGVPHNAEAVLSRRGPALLREVTALATTRIEQSRRELEQLRALLR
jgi:hypothetical protein